MPPDPISILLTAVVSGIVAWFTGARAGARYTLQETERRARERRIRVTTSLLAMAEWAQETAGHNVQVASFGPDTPRAFIPFGTDAYEQLLLEGEHAELVQEPTLSALMRYLQQARHVNTMIRLFEQMEVQFAGTRTAPLGPHKQQYIRAIGNYCAEEIPECLAQLLETLTPATPARKHHGWQFWKRITRTPSPA
jgi:hypothetical protein